jgi:hypothetical protein
MFNTSMFNSSYVYYYDHLGKALAKEALAVELEEQMAAVDEIQDDVEFGAGLEGVVQLHDEGVADAGQDVALLAAEK